MKVIVTLKKWTNYINEFEMFQKLCNEIMNGTIDRIDIINNNNVKHNIIKSSPRLSLLLLIKKKLKF